ncbi:hypothetical protein F4821DRAFT_241260 [Hypoxylon rubiginosum]|uniref:Uncharacterized protein n=1 Tax=Hypoxylon rubiginosum TaxID=110542 RepID=A0ACC0CXI7_9PEZI|nr:hypothetical protein F4821DRAFT_241260 [Hypoxylon rubiginosum]
MATSSNELTQATTSINQSSSEPDVKEGGHYLDDGLHYLYLKALGKLITVHTEAAAAAIRDIKPYNNYRSRVIHNAQQRAIWQRIRSEAAADDDIPVALFSPPRTHVDVRIAEWPRPYHFCCPCDIEEGYCEVIRIRAPNDSEHGITKDMFVQQVGEALYGRDPDADRDARSQQLESDTQGTGHDGYKIGGEEDRPVIDMFTYMRGHGSKAGGGEPLMGPIFALTRGIKEEYPDYGEEDENELIDDGRVIEDGLNSPLMS